MFTVLIRYPTSLLIVVVGRKSRKDISFEDATGGVFSDAVR